MLEYLKNVEGKPVICLLPLVFLKTNNANFKDYGLIKCEKKFENEDSCHAKAIFDSFNLNV